MNIGMAGKTVALLTVAFLMGSGCRPRQRASGLAGEIPESYAMDVVVGFSEGVGLIVVGGKRGFIDREGRTLIAPEFEKARPFSDGLAMIAEGGRYGFIDRTGRRVVEAVYAQAGDFREGLAAVCVNGRWGFIDASGRMAIDPQFEAVGMGFGEGLAAVSVNGRWGFVDKRGKLAIPARYTTVQRFTKPGLAAVQEGEAWGYLDRAGKFAIPPQFHDAGPFFDDPPLAYAMPLPLGRAPYGFIDPSGKWLYRAPPTVLTMGMSGGFWLAYAPVQGKRMGGYMDPQGKWVVPPQFEWVGEFSEGLADVRLPGGSVGYVDKTGKMVIPAQFAQGERFSEGRARVRVGDKWGYIDRTGAWIWKPTK